MPVLTIEMANVEKSMNEIPCSLFRPAARILDYDSAESPRATAVRRAHEMTKARPGLRFLSFRGANLSFLLVAPLLVLLAACGQKETITLQGATMGTSYSIKIRNAPRKVDGAELKNRVDALLQEVDYRFSNWQKDEVYGLNQAPIGKPVAVSPDFCLVLEKSFLIWKISERRFDPGIGELIDLWGFGATERQAEPSEAAIQKALARGGLENLQLTLRDPQTGTMVPGGNYEKNIEILQQAAGRNSENREGPACQVIKVKPLMLNLSGIAKGHGVDRVASLLEQEGITDYMVEIGGEVKTGPANSFRIGIERPNYDGTRSLYTVLESRQTCIATSGNYRNFFERDGHIYSHILIPRIGKPGFSRIQSATVVGPDCALADAMATAAMIARPEETDRMITRLEIYTGDEYDYLIMESGELVTGDTANFELKEYTSFGLKKMRKDEQTEK